MTRVYLAATLGDLETLAGGGQLHPEHAYAATKRLAAEFPDAGEEELEYAALEAAREDAEPPRIVVAADTDTVEDAVDAGVVAVDAALGLADVASLHVETDADDELAWYATQELGDVLARFGGATS